VQGRDDDAAPPAHRERDAPAQGELPVVARMIVEIRSDGTRTLARGAVVDVASGQQVAVEIGAGSPWQLAKSLVGLLLSAPRRAGATMRALVGGRRR
jgi:hypothetical protein